MDLRCVRDIFFFLSKYVLIKCFLIIFNINGYFTVSDSILLLMIILTEYFITLSLTIFLY